MKIFEKFINTGTFLDPVGENHFNQLISLLVFNWCELNNFGCFLISSEIFGILEIFEFLENLTLKIIER